MTVSECRATCMALTFDLMTADSPLFYPALNHAVADLSHFFPQYREIVLHHTGSRECGVRYDIRALAPGFYAFAETPLYGDLFYRVTGDSTLLLYAEPGDYTLYYEEVPPIYGEGDDDLPLAVAPLLLHLVPYFTASLLLLDDDPEKATYYQSLYLSFLTRYDKARKKMPQSFACNENGW